MHGPEVDRIASISIDLDNQWSYMMIHGDSDWRNYPSYLNIVVPRVLREFNRHAVRATWFLVGRDAAQEANRDLFSQVVKDGHEVGNHSFDHDPWLHHYSRSQILRDVSTAHDEISRSTGAEPTGFRGPGYSWTPTLIDVLGELRYRFDASTLPTFIGPIARWYYFLKSDLDPEETELRRKLFGSFSDGFRPLKPYYWDMRDRPPILEIPVTTMPLLRIPFHMSYLLYLRAISRRLMRAYLNTSLLLCKIAGIMPSVLLHPLDFLDAELVPELKFFPAMAMPVEEKSQAFDELITALRRSYEITTMSGHCDFFTECWSCGLRRIQIDGPEVVKRAS